MGVVIELNPATIAKLHLEPGDVVIVKTGDVFLKADQAQEISKTISQVIPDHKVIVLARNMSIEVVTKGAA